MCDEEYNKILVMLPTKSILIKSLKIVINHNIIYVLIKCLSGFTYNGRYNFNFWVNYPFFMLTSDVILE